MSGVSERVNGGANGPVGPVLYASITLSFYPPCVALIIATECEVEFLLQSGLHKRHRMDEDREKVNGDVFLVSLVEETGWFQRNYA